MEQPQAMTTPSCFRAGQVPSGESNVAVGYILKYGTAAEDDVLIASAATDALAGVCIEAMTNGGPRRSYQKSGRAWVLSGGVVSIGDDVTADSTGRAVTASQSLGAPQQVLGRAVSAASGAGEYIKVDLKEGPKVWASIASVATIAALTAVAAADRYNGQLMLVQANNSLWRFNSTAAMDEDTAQELCLAPDAGTGRWIRADKAFILKIPIAYTNTDGQAVETIPESFALRLGGHGYWEVTEAWTGGSSSAIGISSNISGYETGGDLLGGASGDVAATLTAGIAAGTQGGELDDEAGFHALLFEEDSEFQFDRITSVFTAGSGFACFPVFVAAAPATP
jgi:hypothetical protein